MRHSWLMACALALGAASPAWAQGGAPANTQGATRPVQMITTATLAELCGAAPAMSEAPATAFCRGFIIGAGQYHHAVSGAPGQRQLFCIPSPGPTHEQFQTAFVSWVRANPQVAQERAVDGLARFAAATYPCPPAQAAARNRSR